MQQIKYQNYNLQHSTDDIHTGVYAHHF